MASVNLQSRRGQKKMGQLEGDKDVTLGKMINIMNATNTKNASIFSDKALIQDLTSSPSKERINFYYNLSNKADAKEMSIKMMRKELKEQVKRHKANPKISNRHVHTSKWQSISSVSYPVSEESWPETIGAAAPTISRLSSAVESQRSVKQSEGLSGKDVKRDTNSIFSRRSNSESRTNFASQNKNIYSRHLQSNSTEAEEDGAYFEAESLVKDKAAQEEKDRETRRLSNASSVQSFRTDLSKQAFPSTTKSRNKSISQSSQDANDEGAEKVTSKSNVKEKIQDEKEFVETLTDPTLKTSLQRIIQKRRNSVCLMKSITGLKVVDDDGAFSAIAEEKSDLDLESLMAKSDSKIYAASSRSSKSGSILAQKLECGSREDENAVPDWDIKSMKSFHSEASQGRINHLDNPKRSIAYSRTVSTPKKGVRSRKKSSQTLLPDKTKIRTNKVETEETRIIKPLSSKTYRPCLTAKSRAKDRTHTARSSPETSREKSYCASKGKEDVIREFMLMYAKVKQNKKEEERAAEDIKPVRMISATPEFVVKSAIGQFLSCVFPPERPRDSSWEKEERYEDKQRTKLLKIKICMQQLASIA